MTAIIVAVLVTVLSRVSAVWKLGPSDYAGTSADCGQFPPASHSVIVLGLGLATSKVALEALSDSWGSDCVVTLSNLCGPHLPPPFNPWQELPVPVQWSPSAPASSLVLAWPIPLTGAVGAMAGP